MFKPNRRRLITMTAIAAATPLIAHRSYAQELVELAETDPVANALGYKIDAETVDPTEYPKRAGTEGAKQFCANCSLYAAKENGKGACSVIPGKLVAAQGWCNAWIATN